MLASYFYHLHTEYNGKVPPLTGGRGVPGGTPPPQINLDKNVGQKMDKVLDKNWTKFWTTNWTNILETFGGGGGGPGGTPLAVTQADCLVVTCGGDIHVQLSCMVIYSWKGHSSSSYAGFHHFRRKLKFQHLP